MATLLCFASSFPLDFSNLILKFFNPFLPDETPRSAFICLKVLMEDFSKDAKESLETTW